MSRPQVVIVGAGFGGLSAARGLARTPVDVTLIDRQNHHLFQPLLYQVATAGLSPADIAWPVRHLVRDQPNTRVLMGEVTGVDPARRVVMLGDGPVAWDWLVLATGATHGYFGHDDWAAHAPGLKDLDDATAIRRRLLLAFEHAEMASNPAVAGRLLTIVIVGGGPTGVELAGAIAELARRALVADFRAIDPTRARVLLIEAGPRLLPAFPESLSHYTSDALKRLGVEVRLGAPVTACDAEGVTVGDEFIPAATVLWAAGVTASPVASWLGIAGDRAGRVAVGAGLTVPGFDRIHVIGDAALARDARDRPLPGIAPVAKQQGAWVAGSIRARLAGRTTAPFAYRDVGLLATIGRKSAVIAYRGLRLRGWPAWWLWGAAHIYFLVSLRNRLIVVTQWLWSYFAFERGARLITGIRAR
ncbi:MAG TPA: NAD(P)/FAD-dependent oxidoreductase [Steroidobacteraceae bacterium]|nr:NAD(P)/FAD-dependent oxidoreductase [Steroidobacteraceae bacterium]